MVNPDGTENLWCVWADRVEDGIVWFAPESQAPDEYCPDIPKADPRRRIDGFDEEEAVERRQDDVGVVEKEAKKAQAAHTGHIHFGDDYTGPYDAEGCYRSGTWVQAAGTYVPRGPSAWNEWAGGMLPHFGGGAVCFVVVGPPDWLLPDNADGYEQHASMVGVAQEPIVEGDITDVYVDRTLAEPICVGRHPE